MSIRTATIIDAAATAMRATSPPPSKPMAVARALVDALFRRPDGELTLHDHRGDFYHWNGLCWPEIDKRDVRAAAYRLLEHAQYYDPDEGLKPFAPSRRKIDDVMDALRAVVLLDTANNVPLWTDARIEPPAHEMISMANGLLHVPKRTLLAPTPTLFLHHALPFAFDPTAPPASAWLAFLDALWGDDVVSIATLQEVMGYVLGGDTRLQKMFLLVGPKRAGKGTIGRVLTGLLGAHNVAAPTLASLGTNFGLSPLIGRPLALISDARISSKADSKIVVERLLSVSGEDSLTIDRKYKDPWTGRLSARFLIMTNELPRLSDASGALASRFVLLLLTRSFYGAENPRLTDELLAEAPSIFNWALEGLDRLTERGYFRNPPSGEDAIQQLEDLSSPVAAFIRDWCVLAAEAEVSVEEFWIAWKRWCEQDNRHPGTKAVLGRDLRAIAPTVKRARLRSDDDHPNGDDHDRPYVYQGIGIRGNNNGPVLGPLGPEAPRAQGGPSGPRDQSMYSRRDRGDHDLF